MDPVVIAAIIGAVGTITAALITVWITKRGSSVDPDSVTARQQEPSETPNTAGRTSERATQKQRKERLEELYALARKLHQDQKWQELVDVFDDIHSEDPAYPDPEGLLVSAREELATLEQAQRVAALYDQGLQHMEAEEWVKALQCFEELQQLEPGYREATRRLSQVRQELGRRQLVTAGIVASRINQIYCVGILTGHSKLVNAIAFSSDNMLLASGSKDTTVRLWRVADGELVRTLEGHTDWVGGVA